MSAFLDIHVSGDDPIKALSDIVTKADSERFHGYLAAVLTGNILDRTERGIDANEHNFKRYTKGHAKYRAKKGKQTSPPNLRITGAMLSSLQSTPIAHGSAVGVGSGQALKALGNQRYRMFMGISKGDEDQLTKLAWEYLT